MSSTGPITICHAWPHLWGSQPTAPAKFGNILRGWCLGPQRTLETSDQVIQGSVFAMILLVKMAIPRLRSLVEGSLEVKLPSRGGKSQRREEKRRDETRREKTREEKESEERRCRCTKGRKVAIHCVFPMICGSGGSKSRLAKAVGAEPFGQMREEKLHAVVAPSTFRSQNVQSTSASDHFWKLRCRKCAHRCGTKHMSKSKCTKHRKTPQCRTTLGSWDVEKVDAAAAHTSFGPLLEVDMSKKCTPLWRKANFQVTPHAWTTFEGSDVVLRGRSKGLCTLLKMRNFVAFPKTMAGVGHLKRICKDAFRVAGAVQETCSLEMLGLLGGPGADFLREVAFWSIRSSVLGRWNFVWQVQHFVWPGITFRGRRNTLETWTGKIAKLIGTRPQLCTQLSIFERSLAELLPFWCCQLHKLRKSRRIALFLMLSSSKVKGVLQNSFVFQLADR